jgi:FkbM family methyltransferase
MSHRAAVGRIVERSLAILPQAARGRAARSLLRVAPDGMRMSLAYRATTVLGPWDYLPVLAGPLKGSSWVARATIGSCVTGSYESDIQDVFSTVVRPGDVVYDIGANVGFLTLLAAKLVGPAGTVVAFEPDPASRAYLRRHLDLNAVTNVQIVPAAVSSSPGIARFRRGGHISQGQLDDAGELEVGVIALDDYVAAARVPTLVKVDVEGAEVDVLRGAQATIRSHRPAFIVSTHGRRSHRECSSFLERLGYALTELPHDGHFEPFDFLGELIATPRAGRAAR